MRNVWGSSAIACLWIVIALVPGAQAQVPSLFNDAEPSSNGAGGGCTGTAPTETTCSFSGVLPSTIGSINYIMHSTQAFTGRFTVSLSTETGHREFTKYTVAGLVTKTESTMTGMFFTNQAYSFNAEMVGVGGWEVGVLIA